MTRRVHIMIFALLTAFIACEEKSDFELLTNETDLIVVEGIITNEKISHRVKLSRTFTAQNQIPESVTVDTVLITDGEIVYSLSELPLGSGEYYTPPFRAVFGKAYFLVFFYQGTQYVAVDSPPPGQQLDDISYTEVVDDTSIMRKLNFEDSGTNSNFITYDVNWDNTADCFSSSRCSAKLVYYDLKTIDVHEIYQPEKEQLLFPAGSQIVRKKYSVSERYETYLRSLLSETEWRGGIFDIERANVLTNLSEGAIGFFAVSTVVVDTTIVE